MSQYGNSPKTPPWVRSGVAQNTAAVTQSLMAANPLQTAGMLQYPQVFQGQQMYGAVSYPTRALNTAAFQQGQQQGGGSQSGNKQQRVFTGTVTKVQDNFGFVDEDVFFQSSCCVKGSSPQVGDRVLVEAVYNANMPFKWNATRIQVLSMQDQRSGQNYGRSQSNYNAVPPPKVNSGSPAGNRYGGGGSRFSNASGDRGGRGMGGNMRRDEQDSRKRRRDDRDKDDKAKSPPRKRSKSPNRQARRPRRPVPRYSVTVPKTNLNTHEADVVEVKKRYPNMYIPSDFFLSIFQWTETFPIGKPISLDYPCTFHVMHKDVDNIDENNAVLEPPDADYLYCAKVMLMASPGLEELYSKCIVMAEDREGSRSTVDEDSLSHPTRLIHFLVGTRGKENMAIGGPWSPSLDGPNPSEDPGVLVKTAIRTTKALTGIDLSDCTQWFRFMEVHYHRGESVHRGKSYPARVETVVIFVPDVWSCVPTRLEWEGLHLNYQKALSRKLNDHDQKEEEEEVSEKESLSEQSPDKPKREPRHHSELDPKNMKVSELREELEARCLSPKGLKSQLAARLTKVIKTEEEEAKQKSAVVTAEDGSGPVKKEKDVKEKEKEKKEEAKEKEVKDDEKKKKEEEEPKKLDEKERQLLEKRYKLPKKPSILVHPNRTAKSGKFDCHYYSLSVLLGYRQDDTKEHSFEVSVFAELFNEMLMRDFGFNIYRAIVEAPEKPKEEKKDEKEKPKDDKEKPKEEKDKDKEKSKEKEDDKDKKDKDGKEVVDDAKEENKESVDSKDSNQTDKVKDKEPEVQSEAEEMEAEGGDKEDKENKENDKDKKNNDKEPRRERAKLVTLDKELLLSFNFFDTTRCGYIYDKDIEDLVFSLGLTLSRSQVRKLVGKVVSRDAVYYRRLTDRTEGTVLPEHMTLSQLLAFKPMLPYSSQENVPQNGGSRQDNEIKTGQMIVFNGTLVDVGKLMEQLARSESARLDTEKTLGKLRDELSKIKESSSKSEKYIKDLNADVREYRDHLSQTSSELSALQTKERQFMRTLNEISEKIRPLIAKPEPKAEPEIKEIIDLEEKGEEPMAVEEDK
ncbi:cell division cycle and apoptosis regulator protein 1 isoform X3 [Halyomorpha halys]|uniref:cell division cycle and apoptosis regulator protein 1 isoform X3 n=1 Tax=Halyomorpha halys TaxID=286706 RepID=UPI0006D51FE3|nr:cell division cycle and apoptosis regulator protein 1-like isoform X3 [Halyomorpha halys]